MRKKITLLGYEISTEGLSGDVDHAMASIAGEKRCAYMACANPHSIIEAERDPLFFQSLQNAEILLPDGAGILLASRILGLPINERVAAG